MTAGEDICVYLTTRGYTDIHLNTVPLNKTKCICVYDTGGYEATRYYGRCPPDDRPTVQIRIRDPSPSGARLRAYAIYADVDGITNTEINGSRYLAINCTGPPAYLGLDQVSTAGQAHEWTLNIQSQKRRN